MKKFFVKIAQIAGKLRFYEREIANGKAKQGQPPEKIHNFVFILQKKN